MKNYFKTINNKLLSRLLPIGIIVSILLVVFFIGTPISQYFFNEKNSANISGPAARLFFTKRSGNRIETVLRFSNSLNSNFSARVNIYDGKGAFLDNYSLIVNNLAQGRLVDFQLTLPADSPIGTFIVSPTDSVQKYSLDIIETEFISGQAPKINHLNPLPNSVTIIPIDTKQFPQISVRLKTAGSTQEKIDVHAYSFTGEEISLKLSSLVFENTFSLPIYEEFGPDFIGFLSIVTQNASTAVTTELLSTQQSSVETNGQRNNSSSANYVNSGTVSSSSATNQNSTNTINPGTVVVQQSEVLAANVSSAENTCFPTPQATVLINQSIPGSVDIKVVLSQKQKGTVVPFLSKEQITRDCSNLKSEDGLDILASGEEVSPAEWSKSLTDSCRLFVGACFYPCANCGIPTTPANEIPPGQRIALGEINCNDRKLYLKETNSPGAHGFIESSEAGYLDECPEKYQLPDTRCLYYKQGANVNMSAVPEGGFVEWRADCSSSNPRKTCSKTMDVDHTVEAIFKVERVKLYLREINGQTFNNHTSGIIDVVVSSGQELGSCSSSEERPGYRCKLYSKDSQLALTGNPGIYFESYSEDCNGSNPLCKITLNRNYSVTATFKQVATQKLYFRAINELGSTGTVTVSPEVYTNCSNSDQRTWGNWECRLYKKFSSITLTASSPPNQFRGWSGDIVSGSDKNETITLVMGRDKEVTGSFSVNYKRLIYYIEDLERKSGGRIDFSTDGYLGPCRTGDWSVPESNAYVPDGYKCRLYSGGSSVTMNARPVGKFVTWLDNCLPEGTNDTCIRRLSGRDFQEITVGAKFYTAPICGNRDCEIGENCRNCPNDCGACGTTTVTTVRRSTTTPSTITPNTIAPTGGGGCATIICAGVCCPANTVGACRNLNTPNESCPDSGGTSSGSGGSTITTTTTSGGITPPTTTCSPSGTYCNPNNHQCCSSTCNANHCS